MAMDYATAKQSFIDQGFKADDPRLAAGSDAIKWAMGQDATTVQSVADANRAAEKAAGAPSGLIYQAPTAAPTPAPTPAPTLSAADAAAAFAKIQPGGPGSLAVADPGSETYNAGMKWATTTPGLTQQQIYDTAIKNGQTIGTPIESGYVPQNTTVGEESAPQAPAPAPIPVTTAAPITPAVAQQAVAATPYDAAQASVVNAKIDPTKTAGGLLAQYLDPNSPLMVQARTQALQQANASGLLNSSLAASAGESAMIDKATPLATSDSNLYGNAELQNSSLGTNVNVQNAQATNASLAQAKGAQTNVSITNAGLGTDVSKANSSLTAQNNQFNAQADNVASLTAAQLTNQTNIANLQASANLQLQQIQSNTQLSIADRQIQSSQTIAQLQATTQTALGKLSSDTTLSVADKNNATSTVIAAADSANRLQIANIQTLMQEKIATADQANKITLTDMQTTANKDLAYIDANYKTLIQSSASLSSAYSSTLATIAQGLASGTLTADQYNNTMNNFKVMANVIGSINGIKLADGTSIVDLLKFSTATA